MAFDLAQSIDVGHLAKWAVSSHKYGFSVANLRDDNDDTFWQSEGPQPHWIDLAFPKRVMLSSLQIQCLHTQDDSYTPSKISISAGTGSHDLIEIRQYDLEKPNGWISIPLRPIIIDDPALPAPLSTAENPMAGKIEVSGPPIPAFYLRVQILQNHLNGKDTHVRGLRIFGVSGTAIPLSQRVTLPILVSYSATNKPHDPRHPTSQTTAVTKKSTLAYGAQVPSYTHTKNLERPGALPEPTSEGGKGTAEGLTSSARDLPERRTATSALPTHQRSKQKDPIVSVHPTPTAARAPGTPVQTHLATRSENPAQRHHEQPIETLDDELSHHVDPQDDVDRDPLLDPLVQEGLMIMEWGDDGLSGYTSVDLRMHRGIR